MNHAPRGPLGSPPFTAFDPYFPKWGRDEVEEGCDQGGLGNKARIQAGCGPEVANTAPRRFC